MIPPVSISHKVLSFPHLKFHSPTVRTLAAKYINVYSFANIYKYKNVYSLAGFLNNYPTILPNNKPTK